MSQASEGTHSSHAHPLPCSSTPLPPESVEVPWSCREWNQKKAGTGDPALPDEQAPPHRACDGAKTTQGTAKWTLGKKVGDTDNINSKGVVRGLCH